MTDYKNLKLIATSSPHIRGSETTRSIMLDVIIAMLPALIWAVVMFGFKALTLTVVSVVLLLGAASQGFALFYAAVLLFSFGGSWGLGVFYSILPDVFDERSLSTATGFIGGFGDMMMPIAPTVVGVIFGVRGLWSLGWGACALLAVVGVLACAALIGILKKEAKSGASH